MKMLDTRVYAHLEIVDSETQEADVVKDGKLCQCQGQSLTNQDHCPHAAMAFTGLLPRIVLCI